MEIRGRSTPRPYARKRMQGATVVLVKLKGVGRLADVLCCGFIGPNLALADGLSITARSARFRATDAHGPHPRQPSLKAREGEELTEQVASAPSSKSCAVSGALPSFSSAWSAPMLLSPAIFTSLQLRNAVCCRSESRGLVRATLGVTSRTPSRLTTRIVSRKGAEKKRRRVKRVPPPSLTRCIREDKINGDVMLALPIRM